MKTLALIAALFLGIPTDDRPRVSGSTVGPTGAIGSDILYCADETTSTHPGDCVLSGSSSWYGAGAGVARNGGNLVLSAGYGTKIVTVNSFGAGTDGDEFIISTDSLAYGFHAGYYTARNGGAGLMEWDCITSEEVCAGYLAGLINVGTTTGIVATDIACGADWCVKIEPTDPDTYWIEIQIVDGGPGAPFGVTTGSGVDGDVVIPGQLIAYSGIKLPDPNAFVGAQPTCDATTHNVLWTDNGAPDDLEWCAYDGAAYAWTPVTWNPSKNLFTAKGGIRLDGIGLVDSVAVDMEMNPAATYAFDVYLDSLDPMLVGTARVNETATAFASNGTTVITKAGHSLAWLHVGDLVQIIDCTTAGDKGFYRIAAHDANTITLDRALAGTDADVDLRTFTDVVAVLPKDAALGQVITGYNSSNKPLQLGGSTQTADGHGLTAEDIEIAGDMAIKGAAYLDGNAEMGGNDIKNVDDIYGTAVATDAAPRVTVIGTQPVVVTPGATNVTGANLVLQPSPGQRTSVCAANPCVFADGQTITVTMQIDGVSQAPVAKTAGGGAGQFACNGLTPAECCANLAATYVSTPVTGLTIGNDCAASGKLTYNITPGAASYVTVASSAGGITVTSGADGQVMFPLGKAAKPGLALAGDPDTGFYSAVANRLNWATGGTLRGYFSDSALYTDSAIDILSRGGISNDAGNLVIEDVLAVQGASTKGLTTVTTSNTESVTFAGNPGDASKVTTALCPVGAHVVGFSGRCTTTGTNCTGVNIGDGVDPDLYCANCGLTGGTSTFTTDNATAAWSKDVFTSVANVTVTGIGANCYSLVYALTCHYEYTTAATSN